MVVDHRAGAREGLGTFFASKESLWAVPVRASEPNSAPVVQSVWGRTYPGGFIAPSLSTMILGQLSRWYCDHPARPIVWNSESAGTDVGTCWAIRDVTRLPTVSTRESDVEKVAPFPEH